MSAVISFVEYLFTGTLALMWILLIAPRDFLMFLPPDTYLAVLAAIPVLYSLGLVIDALVEKALRSQKRRIKAQLSSEAPSQGRFTSFSIPVKAVSPELAQDIRNTVTRDRIARGFLFNVLVMNVAIAVTPRLDGGVRWVYLALARISHHASR